MAPSSPLETTLSSDRSAEQPESAWDDLCGAAGTAVERFSVGVLSSLLISVCILLGNRFNSEAG